MINRRAALKSLAVLGGAVAIPRSGSREPSSSSGYGYLDVDICHERGLNSASAQVFLDGVDVTGLSVAALDDRAGYIEIYKRDALGKCRLDKTGWRIERERRYGHVEVRFS